MLASVAHPFCAVVARGHPLARRRSLKLRDCLAYPVAMADHTLAGRALIDRTLANASFRFEPTLESNSIETMKAYARLSQAVSGSVRTRRDAATSRLARRGRDSHSLDGAGQGRPAGARAMRR